MSQAASPGAGQLELQRRPHAVFVAYSTEDQAIADAVVAALEEERIGCWIAPRNVQGGRPYSGQITQAIREARILLLILTSASNRSKHVLREVERAAHCQNHLLTFRIEPIAPGDDLAYFLGADQWVDGFRPLPPSQHLPALVHHLRGLIERSAAEREPAAQPDSALEKFAHFRILRHPDGSLFKLGKGGMGVTYKAIDTTLNRPVALKVIAAEQLNSPQAKHRFLREAQSAALIHHPHVATIFHFGEECGAYFYAMEYVEGEDLERYVARQGPLSPASALRVALQVAQALEAAQARHLIHRDIKPGNIMAVVNRTGTLDVKLIDFGLAKGAGTDSLDAARVTRSQDFVGSPAFASPEQCETKKLDIRSDIYSLGVTLWYLLSGKRPFVGTVGEVMVAQIIKPPPFEQLTQMPEPVVILIRKMLEKKPEDRYQTPEALQDAVESSSKRLSEQFADVPDRILPQPPRDGNAPPPVNGGAAEPVALRTFGGPRLDAYLGVEIGALLTGRYRLLAEEREGNGGRLFRARDEQASPGQPREVAVKLLHPGIGGDPELLNLLENELDLIRRQAHPMLLAYYGLKQDAAGPYLIREWVHGFLVYDLLRWRRSLKAAELSILLESLANTLDYVASEGLGLVEVSVRKLLVGCPGPIGEFEKVAKGHADEWRRCTLRLNPLSLAPLLFKTRNDWDLHTIVPSTRVLSMTQAEAGIRGTKAVRLYGRLIYELLSGRLNVRDSDANRYAPLPELDQKGNEVLRKACAESGERYQSCHEFWDALKENLVNGGRPAGPVRSPPVPLASASSRKRSPILVGGIIATAIPIICFAVFAAFRLTNFSTKAPALSEKIATPSPLLAAITPGATPVVLPPTPSPVATGTPEPTAAPTRRNMIANSVYEGTIHAKDDSSTSVPLILTIGSDVKSGKMTQSGHHGDLVVKFTGVWDGFTLHAVTDEVVSQPKGIRWDPESFTLRFGNDGKSATYECVADRKTYVADLSLQPAPTVKTVPIYQGTIHKRGESASGTPLTVNFAADRKSGTMTYTSKSGETVVRFNGKWDSNTLRADTTDVIAKPANIQWKAESFTLRFFEDGKRGSYQCDSDGQLYEAELIAP
jgi:serine/threonine protein kinase